MFLQGPKSLFEKQAICLRGIEMRYIKLLVALVLSFGSYMVRWGLSARLGQEPRASSRGHFAGVANYVLALIGGVAVLPVMDLSPWLLEPTFVTVALLNVSGTGENLGLIVEMLLTRRR